MTIPSLAHFFWIGPELPWIHRLAVRSCAVRGGFQEVVLHHTDDLTPEVVDELERTPSVRLRRLDLEALMERAGGPPLVDLYRELESPVARSNLFRAAEVFVSGGVYFDLDIVCVRSFAPLLKRAEAFVGEEHIVFPATVRRSHNPAVVAAAYAKTALRDLFRRLPEGHRHFGRIAWAYPRAVNGAILGAPARHEWLREYLAAMVQVPRARRQRPHALGTHLLQDVTTSYMKRRDDLRVLEPDRFYPLAPEISQHWFRERSRLTAQDRAVALPPETLAAHWYASVRTKTLVRTVDAAYVRAHRDRELFSSLAAEIIDELASVESAASESR